jgi:regulator of protease activity HflC (stomatin/prohibitin superfamily)
VGKLYGEFQLGYETRFISYVDSVVRKVVGDFNSTAFWNDRANSGRALKQAIDLKLQESYANCMNLQIINVQLSTKREESLIQTQVTNQQGKTKQREQTAKEIRSSITVA